MVSRNEEVRQNPHFYCDSTSFSPLSPFLIVGFSFLSQPQPLLAV